MSPFDAPDMPAIESIEWMRAAKPCFANPDLLWGSYWHRFNTITIPILDMTDYFQDAMDASKLADDRQHLESILADKAQVRKVDLIEKMNAISIAAFTQRRRFSSMNTRYEASKAAQYGCLDRFVHFLHGEVYGWDNEQPDFDFASVRKTQDADAKPGATDGGGVSGSSSEDGGEDGSQPETCSADKSPGLSREHHGEVALEGSSSHDVPPATDTVPPAMDTAPLSNDEAETSTTDAVTTATPLPVVNGPPPAPSTPTSSTEHASLSPAPSSTTISHMDMPITPSPPMTPHLASAIPWVCIPDEATGTSMYENVVHQSISSGQSLSRKRARVEYDDEPDHFQRSRRQAR